MITLYPHRLASDYKRWSALLKRSGIRPETSVEDVYGLEVDDALIATASLDHNIIKCVAIDEAYQGGAAFHELLSGVLSVLYQRGITHMFVYTKPDAARSFEALGFSELERVDETLVFMERPAGRFQKYLHQLSPATEGPSGAIVMNANPFTNGHLSLIERALHDVNSLHVFVVSEDASVFPAIIRQELVAAAVGNRPEISLHETASYLVSAATFPSYFLPERADVTRVQARLDARLFRRHIAPVLNLTHRFVGEEPLSPITATYNAVMAEVFSAPDAAPPLKLMILPRLEADGAPISASTVRQLLAEGKMDDVAALVPPTTLAFLRSDRAKPILKALKNDPLHEQKPADARRL
ncbi:MAG: [citrate (pro-3S)-lyase] ligase [Peptoniphilaceae bacterium]|nr:[citrate (pro-3S)-lyase] ligase [Peptoniphilaceae bacterium]